MYIIFTILAHYEFTLMFELDVTRRILMFWVCSKFDLKVDTTQHQIPSTLRRGNFLLIPYRIATQLYLKIPDLRLFLQKKMKTGFHDFLLHLTKAHFHIQELEPSFEIFSFSWSWLFLASDISTLIPLSSSSDSFGLLELVSCGELQNCEGQYMWQLAEVPMW